MTGRELHPVYYIFREDTVFVLGYCIDSGVVVRDTVFVLGWGGGRGLMTTHDQYRRQKSSQVTITVGKLNILLTCGSNPVKKKMWPPLLMTITTFLPFLYQPRVIPAVHCCYLCGEQFPMEYSLGNHLDIHHTDIHFLCFFRLCWT